MNTIRTFLDRARLAIEGPDGPPIAWTLRRYRPDQISSDVVAGLTVAALIVPLSIGYAGVAGLPPEVGLYASLAPLVAYAVFGSGRRLIVGPDASTAALIAATIAPLAVASDDRVRLAGALGLLVAAIFVAMRLGRMGFLADFLSRPILVGYMTGVGLVVAFGQVERILGGPAIADGLGVLSRIDWLASNPIAVSEAVGIAIRGSGAELASLLIGVGVVVTILLGRHLAPRVPWALLSMLVALGLSAFLDLQSEGVRVLGPVPAGLPPVGIPIVSPAELLALVPGALGLAILSFADTAVTGRTFAARHGEHTDANRELVALAASDAAGALTGGYPISASPSRTGAAEGAGSTSQMTGLVAAVAVGVVLVLLTGPLSYLPIPALGGVILVASLGLIDVRAIVAIWRLKPSEAIIAVIAMTSVILYGTLVGVAIAVLLAALNIVRRAASPQIVEEGRVADGSWRDLTRRSDARRVVGVVSLRFAGPIFFANVAALQARIRTAVQDRPETQAIILDLTATADIDLTAADAIRGLEADLARDGRRLAVARPLGHVRDELRAYGLAGLMEATSGTHGSVDAAIRGVGLDPTDLVVDEPVPTSPSTPDHHGLLDLSAAGPTERTALRLLAGGVAILVGAVVISLVVGGTAGRQTAGPGTVPNLVGLPLDRATTAARDAGFELADPVFVARDDQPEGTVVDQEPPAGTIADLGSEIKPLVSTERQLVVVPDVIGLPEGEAIAALTREGLTVRRAAESEDPSVPPGTVITTSPAAGTTVATGTAVAYVVAYGGADAMEPTAAP